MARSGLSVVTGLGDAREGSIGLRLGSAFIWVGTVMAWKDGRPNDVALDRDHVELIGEVLSAHPRRLSASMVPPGTTLLE